ncbi:GntR family transcriptional regulator [Glycomyces tarimensis]
MAETLVGSERQTLADEVYVRVKARIMESELAPGQKVSIDGLARVLEVSQTPVREALARLESEGLLERRPLSGYTVTPLLSRDEFEDLFDMRLLLEPEAARRAAARGAGDADLLAELRGIADIPAEGLDRQAGQLAFTEADERFHTLVAQLSGSAILAKSILRLDAHLHLHRSYIPPADIAETQAEHLAVTDAIIAKKPLAAERAMRRHLEAARVRHAAAFQSAGTADPKNEVNRTP